MIETNIKCPFLEEMKMASCKAYPIKKMIPVASITENPCATADHFHCPVYEERAKDSVTFHVLSMTADQCPFFEESNMMYCKVYPIKKMIPISAMQLESCCTKEAYTSCDSYLEIAEGDKKVKVRGFLMRTDLSYHKGHTWVKRVKEAVKVGFDDFASRLLGTIEKVEIPAKGETVKVNTVFLKVRCGNYAAESISPLSGTVAEVNECLVKNPHLIQRDPYGQGWLLTVIPSNVDETLLSGMKAQEWMDKEVERFHSFLEKEVGVTLTDGGEMIKNLHEKLSIDEWNRLTKTFLRSKGGV
jgi:glycine cleavage system H protein